MNKILRLFILSCAIIFTFLYVGHAKADEEIVWEKTADMYFNSIAFDGHKYVGVSKKGIFISTDLANWENVDSSGIYPGLTDVNWNGNQFLAFANWSDTYAISSDGEQWMRKKFDDSYMVFDIIWDGQKYFMLGNSTIKLTDGSLMNGPNTVILSSYDGLTWSKCSIFNAVKGLGMDKWQDSMVYNGYTYVAVGDEGTTFLSNDGISWTGNVNKWGTTGSGMGRFSCTKVIWDGTDFVTISGCDYVRMVYKSKDGVKWNTVYSERIPDAPFSTLAFNDGRYVIAGTTMNKGDIHTGFILESSDCKNWTKTFEYQSVARKDEGINRHHRERMITIGNKFVLFGEGGVFLGEMPAPIKVLVNGKNVLFDQNPKIINGRVMVPMRAILEQMGVLIEWDNSTNTLTAKKDNKTLLLQQDSATAIMDGQPIGMDVPVQVIEGRTFAPTRYIAEWLGAKINWDDDKRIITIAQ